MHESCFVICFTVRLCLCRPSNDEENPELGDSGGPHGDAAVWGHRCAHPGVRMVQGRKEVKLDIAFAIFARQKSHTPMSQLNNSTEPHTACVCLLKVVNLYLNGHGKHLENTWQPLSTFKMGAKNTLIGCNWWLCFSPVKCLAEWDKMRELY